MQKIRWSHEKVLDNGGVIRVHYDHPATVAAEMGAVTLNDSGIIIEFHGKGASEVYEEVPLTPKGIKGLDAVIEAGLQAFVPCP